jgi:hypothetical protein
MNILTLHKRAIAAGVLVGVLSCIASAQVAAYPREWQSKDVSGLTALARQFRSEGASRDNDKKLLAGYVVERYEAKSAASPAEMNDWCVLIGELGSCMPLDKQAVIASDLQSRLAPDGASLLQLSATTFGNLRGALVSLKQTQTVADLCAGWVAGSENLDAISAGDLFAISKLLPEAKASRDAAVTRLSQYVTTTYLSDLAKLQSLNCKQWCRFAGRMARLLPVETRVGWVAATRQAFAASPEALASLKVDEALGVAKTLSKLGDDLAGASVAVTIMNSGQAWQSLPPSDLLRLGGFIKASGHPSAVALRGQLGELLTARYVANTPDKPLTASEWYIASSLVGEYLTPENKTLWASRVQSTFAGSSEAIAALSREDLGNVGGVFYCLGDKRGIAQIGAVRVKGISDWSSIDLESLRQLCTMVLYGDASDPEIISAQSALMPQLAARAGRQTEGAQAKWFYCNSLCKMYGVRKDRANAKVWAMNAYDAAVGSEESRAQMDLWTLGQVAETLSATGQIEEGKGYPAYVAAVVSLARKGGLTTSAAGDNEALWFLSIPLCSVEARDAVKSELSDPSDHVNVSLAKILTWSYFKADKLDDWKQFLASKIAAEGGNADAKARWLIGRGLAEAMDESGEAMSPQKGLPYFRQAFEAAAADLVRIEALRYVAYAYAAAGPYDEGRSFLAMAGQRFAAGTQEKEIEALDKSIVQGQVLSVKKEVLRTQARAAYWERQAADAEGRGDLTARDAYRKKAQPCRQRESELLQQLGQ